MIVYNICRPGHPEPPPPRHRLGTDPPGGHQCGPAQTREDEAISVPERDLAALGAVAARAAIQAGEITAEDLTRACLDRIAELEDVVGAWAFLDPELALDQARALDARRRAGEAPGSLHGLPVGIKDIIDTADMPTECNSALMAGRRPLDDATAVRLLRDAGAVIMGKTVTTEMALSAPGKTTNPHDPGRTPGGSSSGSAAAVAAGMVPLAVGSQTGGSMIRPASFCGVFGFKPTFGSIPRRGVSMLSRRLDTLGVYGRAPEDLALIADVLMVPDPGDWDMRGNPAGNLVKALQKGGPKSPRFAFVRGPVWDQGEPGMHAALEAFAQLLGKRATDVALEGVFADIAKTHETVMNASLAANLGEALEKTPDKLRDVTRERVGRGLPVSAADYIRALGLAEAQAQALDRLFDHYDAIITPASAGEAPEGLESTGLQVFNGMWTLLGVPAVSVPLLTGPNGLPIGVQVIGRMGADGHLLRVARWLWDRFGEGG